MVEVVVVRSAGRAKRVLRRGRRTARGSIFAGVVWLYRMRGPGAGELAWWLVGWMCECVELGAVDW